MSNQCVADPRGLQQEQDATGAAAQIFVLLSTENPWAVLCEIWVCLHGRLSDLSHQGVADSYRYEHL